MYLEELMPNLRSNQIIFRKDKDKITFLKFEQSKIMKRFMFGDLITDWAHSQINDQDLLSDDWQIY